METAARNALIALILLAGALAGRPARGAEAPAGAVGYVAGGTVYIDLGAGAGVAPGDTIRVVRDGVEVDRMVVLSVASNAASCRPLGAGNGIRVGDAAVPILLHAAEPSGRDRTSPPPERTPPTPVRNRLRGRVALGSLLSDDLTESGLDFTEPALSARLTMDRIAGRPLSLALRHRTRRHDRERAIGGELSGDRWAHELFELALAWEPEGAPLRLSAGRILPRAPRGLGIIDGVMAEYRVGEDASVGVAAGSRPDRLDAGFQGSERTFGVTGSWEGAVGPTGRSRIDAAFTGRYRDGTVDREYFYLEGGLSGVGRFSGSSSVEIDLNRGWKRDGGEGLLEVAGLYLTGRYRWSDAVDLHGSFDSRRRQRDLQNRTVPDSLFDDALRRGVRGGASWRATGRVRLSGSVGVRLRDGMDDTWSGAGSVRIRDFPLERMTTNARLSIFRSMFNRGYRSSAGVGFSPAPGVRVDLRGGDTVIDGGGSVTHDPWAGSTVDYRFHPRRFVAVSLDARLADRLRSVRLFAETGVLF